MPPQVLQCDLHGIQQHHVIEEVADDHRQRSSGNHRSVMPVAQGRALDGVLEGLLRRPSGDEPVRRRAHRGAAALRVAVDPEFECRHEARSQARQAGDAGRSLRQQEGAVNPPWFGQSSQVTWLMPPQ